MATATATSSPTATAAATTTTHQSTPSWTGSLMNLLNPFAIATPDSVNDATTDDTQNNNPQSPLKRPLLSAVLANVSDSGAPLPSRSSDSVMFAEPDTRSTSETGSREGSVDGRRRSKRSIRPKTQYSICHPPPEGSVRQKLHRRPRSLLQLHTLSPNARPRPALEVVPSANFSIRLTRAVTNIFKAKHGLCPDDLVVLKAEKYSSEGANEERAVQDVIGLICKGRKDEDKDRLSNGPRATIHLASGKVWEARVTPNGAHEFVTTDEHGLVLTVRWWAKRPKDGSRRSSTRRFNFSTISPNSRKHPVIATLSSSGLDIYHSHTIPEPGAKTPLSSPRNDSFPIDDEEDEESNGKEQCETDHQLRELITITSIWVTFKEGWSPTIKFDDKDAVSTSPSKTLQTPLNSPPGSPAHLPLDKRSSIKSISSGIVRRSSILSRSNRNSTQSMPEDLQSPSRSSSVRGTGRPRADSSSSTRKTGRARADSSSTVLVHRAASNRRKNQSQATWRPDLVHTQDTVPEASREDIPSIKTSPRVAVASPLLADIPQSPDDVAGPGATTSVGPERSRASAVKPRRESTSSAKTDLSTVSRGVDGPGARMVRRVSGRKKGRSVWRRLLCR